MEWEPEDQAWETYINMELRYQEAEKARAIYERFIIVHPETKIWIRYALFERHKQRNIDKARTVFERAAEYFGDEFCDEKFYVAYAEFEESCRDFDRSRAIYKYAMEKLGMYMFVCMS